MPRIDTRVHAIPADYRAILRKAGVGEAGGREMPDWSPHAASRQVMRTTARLITRP